MRNVGVSSNSQMDMRTAGSRLLNQTSGGKTDFRKADASVGIVTNRANNRAHMDDHVTWTVLNGTPTASRIHPHASPPSSLGEARGVARVVVRMADEDVIVVVAMVEATAAHSKAIAIHAVSLGTGLHIVPTPLK